MAYWLMPPSMSLIRYMHAILKFVEINGDLKKIFFCGFDSAFYSDSAVQLETGFFCHYFLFILLNNLFRKQQPDAFNINISFNFFHLFF